MGTQGRILRLCFWRCRGSLPDTVSIWSIKHNALCYSGSVWACVFPRELGMCFRLCVHSCLWERKALADTVCFLPPHHTWFPLTKTLMAQYFCVCSKQAKTKSWLPICRSCSLPQFLTDSHGSVLIWRQHLETFFKTNYSKWWQKSSREPWLLPCGETMAMLPSLESWPGNVCGRGR